MDDDATGTERDDARHLAETVAAELVDVVYALQVAPDLRFRYVSDSVLALSGYTPAELYADASIAVDPTETGHHQALASAAALPPGARFDFSAPWTRKDGQVVWTQHRCQVVQYDDGSVVVYAAGLDLTAHKEVERALAASESHYRLLAENASDVVWRTNLDAEIEWVSPSVAAVMGWTPEEMLATRILDQVHPDDLERVQVASAGANAGGRVSFEARYHCKDGSYRWLEITARPLLDADGTVIGKVGSCRDVHSEVEAWHALERSEERFRMAMESAPSGLAVLALDGSFIEVNAALCTMLDHDQEWLMQHDLFTVTHPADEGRARRLRDTVLEGGPPTVSEEVRLVRSDHAVVWAQFGLGLLRDEDGIPMSLVAQFINVTEAHESREALRFMATHDSLTGLLNRRELLVQMSMMLAHPRRSGARMAVLFADLDGLKAVNDSFGHAAGDILIVEAGRRIDAQVRDEDLTARIGGDEFVVVLPEIGSIDDALAVADKIHRAFDRAAHVAGEQVHVGVSIGIAVSRTGDDATALLRQADTALYRAKSAGRHRIEVYDREPASPSGSGRPG
jgi:diguanylate cyclase (GGDEF)-like protein/PAS domain S-box-containing protein